MTQAHPFDRLVEVAPALRPWWESTRDFEWPLNEQWSDLAHAVVESSHNGAIPDIHSIAPLLEEFLEAYDEDSQVSLGFIETLIGLAEQREMNTTLIRDALGVRARDQWESLYQYLHQQHIYPISLTSRDLGLTAFEIGSLDRWFLQSGAHVPIGAEIAAITLNGVSCVLRLGFACYLGKFGPSSGHPVHPGDLLLYVMPERDAHVPPLRPYGDLILAGAKQSAAV